MKTFKEYLAESQRVFRTRIKTVVPVDDHFIARLEQFLQRYHVLSVGKPQKTILQRRPLDFPNAQNTEVYIIDCEFGTPVSSYVLRTELPSFMGIQFNDIVVRNENEPVELNYQEIDQVENIKDQAAKKDLHPDSLLSTDSNYHASEFTADGQNYYGNSYTGRLLAVLDAETEHEPQKVDAHAPLFGWLDMPKEQEPVQPDQDFNADVDALKIMNKKAFDAKPLSKDAKIPAPEGNFQSAGSKIKRDYKNDAGKVSTLTAKKK